MLASGDQSVKAYVAAVRNGDGASAAGVLIGSIAASGAVHSAPLQLMQNLPEVRDHATSMSLGQRANFLRSAVASVPPPFCSHPRVLQTLLSPVLRDHARQVASLAVGARLARRAGLPLSCSTCAYWFKLIRELGALRGRKHCMWP